MALQYDASSSRVDFQAALTANPTLSRDTQDAIIAILGNSETVAVGSFDGTNLVAPSNVQAVVADIAGKAGDQVIVTLPADAMASASAWVFNSDADLTVAFNTVERVIASGNGNDTITVAGDKDTVLDGANGNDTLQTSGGNDSVTGGAGDDSISTGAGNDTIVSGEGNDTIDAGTGFDIVSINGASSNFDFNVVDGSLVATAKDGSASVTASNAEVFSFGETDNVMITGSETDAQALRLYEAFFARSADIDGAKYWLNDLAEGQMATDIARSFLASEEFQSKGNLSDAEYIDILYQNALGRESDTVGKAYWLNDLASGMDRADVAISIVGSVEAAEVIDNVVIITGLV